MYNLRLLQAADMYSGQFRSLDMIAVDLESEFQIVNAPDKSSFDSPPAKAAQRYALFMKTLLISHIAIILCLSSCIDNSQKHNAPSSNDTTKSLQETDSSIKVDNSLDTNFVDKNGLKQGLWYEINSNGDTCKATYKDNVLNGYSWSYFKQSNERIFQLTYFENGNKIWTVIPHYFNLTHPSNAHTLALKGFMLSKDSVYIKAPHENGVLWFEGTYIKSKYGIALPSGTQKIYFNNGKIHYIENWTLVKRIEDNVFVNGTSFLNGRSCEYSIDGEIINDTIYKMQRFIM